MTDRKEEAETAPKTGEVQEAEASLEAEEAQEAIASLEAGLTQEEDEAHQKARKFSKSRTSRFFRVGTLAGKVSTSYLGQKIKKVFVNDEKAEASLAAAHLRNALRVAKTLGQLKGALMKVGQMMSLYSDILPKEFTTILASLQKQAPPVSFPVIRGQMEREFDRSLEEVFSEIEEYPYASASIGQVHRGILKDGRRVVAKVQYPGVDQTIDSDMKNLRMLARSLGLMKKERGVDELIAEVRARLVEELDYLNEIKNINTFRKLFADDDRIIIPRGYEDVSTERVLVMEYVRGEDFSTLCKDADRSWRNTIGQSFVDLFFTQLFRLHVLHADPNPGNFSFLRDGRIIFYDFGCVKYFEEEFIDKYTILIRETLEGRYEKLVENCELIGVEQIGKKRHDWRFYKMFADPILVPFEGHEPYDFGQARIHDVLIELAAKHWTNAFHFRSSPDIIFLNRVVVGMYNNLRRLAVQGRWRAMIEPYLS